MLVNVAVPYRTVPSEPRSLEMAFSAPSQPDFLFSRGPVEIVCQPLQRGLALHWSLCRNLLTTPLAAGDAPLGTGSSAALTLDMDGLGPGFYDLHVVVTLSGTQTVSAFTTFGWHALEEPLVLTEPPDFDLFWQQAQAALPNSPVGLRCESAFTLRGEEIGQYNLDCAALPEHYDPDGEKFQEVEVYKVRFDSAAGGLVHGGCAKPPGPGPFPALLVLPGAGNSARPAPVEHARHGYAALDIQVHGYPPDLELYPPLPEPFYESPKTYGHYPVYLSALQAVGALRHLPGADPGRLAVTGGSQGGRLSVVVAALDPRVRAAVPAITHYAYRPWLQWTERCNLAGDAGAAGFRPQDRVQDARAQVEQYFDAVHFAARVRCPALMNAGLIDRVSPATSVYAVYRRLTSPKQITPLPNLAHDWSPAFDRFAWRWLDDVLGS